MPSNKVSLKNTKTKKAPITYDNRWEQEFSALRKVITERKYRHYSYYSTYSECKIVFEKPGVWSIGLPLQIIPINGKGNSLNGTGIMLSAKGASPAEAFHNLMDVIKRIPDGYCTGTYTARKNPVTQEEERIYTPLVWDSTRNKWVWLDSIKRVVV